MSGGSMNYLSQKVQDAEFREHTPERKAFRKHLQLIAEALHRIEWNDSGDGARDEEGAIRACLHEGAILEQTIQDAKKAQEALTREIERVAGKTHG